jgi:hypothetical protein
VLISFGIFSSGNSLNVCPSIQILHKPAKDQNAILESRFESHNEVLRSHEDQMVKLTKEKS